MRLARAILLSFVSACVGASGVLPADAQVGSARAGADFGSPPSGRVPLLFNDRHVYVSPDTLHDGRVLAALVSNNQLLPPLRSMFEQMGAKVTYDSSSQTITVSKEGAGEIRLAVGKATVEIAGQERPLAVAPILVGDIVLVPVRVISEALGAYVQWLPDSESVGIRYVDTTAPPVADVERQDKPEPPAARPVVPRGPDIPVPPPPQETFIAYDALPGASVSNEVTSGKVRGTSHSSRFHAVSEFTLLDTPMAFELNIGMYSYVPAATLQAEDHNIDLHAMMQMSAYRKIYAGIGYLGVFKNFAFPPLRGLGVGVEKLPFLDRKFSFGGSFWYYPAVGGLCPQVCAGGPYTLSYRALQYDVGATYLLGKRTFLDAGFLADHLGAKSSPLGDMTHKGMRAGVGLHL